MLVEAVSLSLSVTVAVKLTVPAAMRTSSSGDALPPVGWVMARIWSKVTSPVPFTLIRKASTLPIAVRPTTSLPDIDRTIASPVATSVKPLAALDTPKLYTVLPAPSAP